MDLIDISKKILEATNKLKEMRAVVSDRGIKRANAIVEYDKALAITMIKLRNGIEMTLDGEKIINPPTTILEKVAKGICWKERIELEEAEAFYKSVITNIEAVKAELNGMQSLHKNLN